MIHQLAWRLGEHPRVLAMALANPATEIDN